MEKLDLGKHEKKSKITIHLSLKLSPEKDLKKKIFTGNILEVVFRKRIKKKRKT